MSSPESVSSSTAIVGRSSAICTISKRFFSPPEKPSLTLRWRNFSSMSSSFICSLSRSMNSRTGISSPVTELSARRRKLVSDTPGISTGYCIARNRPAWARSSGSISSTSSPSRVMLPPVTS